jgi:apolipoprotein N-acyltransferase
MPASRPGDGGTADSRWCRLLIPILAGFLHAVLMTAAFPPFDLWPFVLAAPLPLLWLALRDAPAATDLRLPRRQRFASAFRLMGLVALGVLPFDLFEQQWIIDVSGLGFLPLAGAMALFPGFFVILLRRLCARLHWLPASIAAPILWAGLEVLRGEIAFTGYPWYLLAHPLIASPLLSLPAAIIGTYGISLLAAIPASAIAELAWRRPRRCVAPFVMSAVTLATIAAAPLLTPPPPGGEPFRIGVVQTNLPQDNKLEWTPDQRLADFDRFVALTRQAAAATPHPDVIVWPETMFPGWFLDPPAIAAVRDAEAKFGRRFEALTYFYDALLAFQKDLGIPLLIGALGVDNARIVRVPDERQFDLESDARYNSVFLVTGGAVARERYDKIVLTPFGEIMPYIGLWPWLQEQVLALGAHGMKFDLKAGQRPVSFRIPSHLPDRPEVGIATPICFEATKPSLCRRLLAGEDRNPKAIVNLTNDGWFGAFDPGRWQHLQIARWRAVELGVPVVRAANTGVSAWIDARGRLRAAGVENGARPARVDGVLIVDIAPGREPTIYSRTGDVVGWSALGGTLVLTILSILKRPPGAEPTLGRPALAEESRS